VGKREIHKPAKEIGLSLFDLCISLGEICKSSREIPISLEDLPISSGEICSSKAVLCLRKRAVVEDEKRTRSVSEGQPDGSPDVSTRAEMLALAHASGSFPHLEPLHFSA